MCQMSSKLTMRKSLGVLPPLASPEAEQLDRTAGRSEATWHNDGDGNFCDTAKYSAKEQQANVIEKDTSQNRKVRQAGKHRHHLFQTICRQISL